MKNYEEIANSVFERRDAYVTRQKQKRQMAMKIASVTCAFALVALGAFGVAKSGWLTPDTPPVDDPAVTAPTTEPTEEISRPTGGDENACTEHSLRYHSIPSNFRDYDIETWVEFVGDGDEGINIVSFVEYYEIPRSEFIETMGWNAKELDELMDDKDGHRYCPYTYNQFLDAIYGDDEDLAAWVFASEITWPEMEEPAE